MSFILLATKSLLNDVAVFLVGYRTSLGYSLFVGLLYLTTQYKLEFNTFWFMRLLKNPVPHRHFSKKKTLYSSAFYSMCRTSE